MSDIAIALNGELALVGPALTSRLATDADDAEQCGAAKGSLTDPVPLRPPRVRTREQQAKLRNLGRGGVWRLPPDRSHSFDGHVRSPTCPASRVLTPRAAWPHQDSYKDRWGRLPSAVQKFWQSLARGELLVVAPIEPARIQHEITWLRSSLYPSSSRRLRAWSEPRPEIVRLTMTFAQGRRPAPRALHDRVPREISGHANPLVSDLTSMGALQESRLPQADSRLPKVDFEFRTT